MFGLTIANPALWVGAFALGVPLLVHLMTRKTPVTITFPTTRLPKKVKANQSRVYRVRHWLMLVLRTLALALLLFAFLRPEYRARALVNTPNTNAAHAAVVLVDTSMSMRYAGEGFTSLARAKVIAERVLRDLGQNDVAGVIFMGPRPESVFDELRSHIDGLVEAVEKREAGYGRADVDSAIALAMKQLQSLSSSVKELHIVSDFQRTNWTAVNFAAIPENVNVVFESVGPEGAANAAITQTAVNPPYAVSGEPMRLDVTVANYSDVPRDFPVSVSLGGEKLPEKRATLNPRSSATIQFAIDTKQTSAADGEVTIPEDGLAPDNTRRFTVRVNDRIPVAILTDNASTGAEAAHRFLRAALDPLEGRRSIFNVKQFAPSAFGRSAAGAAQVAIVSQVQAFSEATAASLTRFARDGGGIIYFVSEPTDAANIALIEKLSEGQFAAPVTLGEFIEGEGQYAVLQQANYDQPMLRKFRETGALAAPQFFKYAATTRREAQGQILLAYDNGNAALAYKNCGLGGVLLANFSPDARSTTLPKHPVFVPLLHEMVKAMRPQSDAAMNFVAGEPASMTVHLPAPGAAVRFLDPDGAEISAGLDTNGTDGTIIFKNADRPGFWRVTSNGQMLGSVAVNVDARESDLATLTLGQLKELAAASKARFLAEQGVNLNALQALRHGLPFWHYALIAAIAMLALEQIFAWTWKR